MLDCLVIGAGPAGLTAALYLRRYHRAIRIVSLADSRALKIDCSRNVPGFPDGISGSGLLQRLRQQLAAFDGEVLEGAVTGLRQDGAGAFVAEAGPERVVARTVLLATGVEDIEPALPGVDVLRREGRLRQCPICDGHEHSGQRIAVLGQGDHGAREALFLRRFSERVLLFDQHPCDPIPEARRHQLAAAGIDRVEATLSAVEIGAAGQVRLLLADSALHEADVVYAALGSRPRNALALGLGAALDERGNIVTDAHLRSSVPGLYAAGDVVSALDQIAVAHGHAAIAATAIHNSLD
jgi:thioredoxin reductase (NADPH)